MQHLDEGTIHAWLDGELPSEERERAAAHVAQCAECAAAVAEARGFIAASSRILTALDSVPGGVLPKADAPSGTAGVQVPRRFVVPRAWMAVAAVLVLSTVTVVVTRSGVSEKNAIVAMQRAEPEVDKAAPSRDTSAPASAAPVAAQSRPAENRPAAPADFAAKARTKDAQALKGSVAQAPAQKASAAGQTQLADRKAEASESESKREAPEAQRDSRRLARADADSTPAGVSVTSQSGAALLRDSMHANRVQLGSVVVTGAGITSTREKLAGNAPSLADSGVHVVSRRSSAENGEPVEVTTYLVHGAYVTLINRPRPDTTRRTLDDSLMKRFQGKTDSLASTMNSITWTDTAGRVLMLRGPVSKLELEQLKQSLFGPKP